VVDVYLYGKLRRYAVDPRPDRDSVVRLEPQPGETVGTVLERLGIPPGEICHVFLNGALLSTYNAMAPWLRYRRVGAGNGLDTPVRAGDRLGLFAHDMALLVV
jgi:hypothetical protein